MKLIVGLGNPGRIYLDSRHNIGSSLVKDLARIYKIPLKRESATFSLSGKGKIGAKDIILAIPLTFMNSSGAAVASLIKRHKIGLEDLLVICDDLDLEFGRIKIRASGSSGGHRGLKSIISSLGSQAFCRLRIGIGRPAQVNLETAEYVLSPFHKREKAQLKGIMEKAVSCCEAWVTKGISESMNIFNRGALVKPGTSKGANNNE